MAIMIVCCFMVGGSFPQSRAVFRISWVHYIALNQRSQPQKPPNSAPVFSPFSSTAPSPSPTSSIVLLTANAEATIGRSLLRFCAASCRGRCPHRSKAPSIKRGLSRHEPCLGDNLCPPPPLCGGGFCSDEVGEIRLHFGFAKITNRAVVDSPSTLARQ